MFKDNFKIFMVLLMFFSTIAPVYAITFLPSVKNLANGTYQMAGTQKKSADRAAPCHDLIRFHEQELCFKHCLQYLNVPCLVPSKIDVMEDPERFSNPVYIVAIFRIPPSSLYEVSSSRDPPHYFPWVSTRTGISAIILQTSRIRR